MNDSQKQQLTQTIADGLSQANMSIQSRMLAQFTKADSNYARLIEEKLL